MNERYCPGLDELKKGILETCDYTEEHSNCPHCRSISEIFAELKKQKSSLTCSAARSNILVCGKGHEYRRAKDLAYCPKDGTRLTIPKPSFSEVEMDARKKLEELITNALKLCEKEGHDWLNCKAEYEVYDEATDCGMHTGVWDYFTETYFFKHCKRCGREEKR